MKSKAHHALVSKAFRGNARRLRRSPTDAERIMWLLLRDRRFAGFKFRRQVPFQRYILDFACFKNRIVVELDGGQHLDSEKDRERDALLTTEGFRVLRYWNNDVLKDRPDRSTG